MVTNSNKGFSLVEVLVATGIVAILLGASSQLLVDSYKSKKKTDVLVLVNEMIYLNSQILFNKNIITKYLNADTDPNFKNCIAGKDDVDCALYSKLTPQTPAPLGTNDMNGRMVGLSGFCSDFDTDPTCLVRNTFDYTLECSKTGCDKLTFNFNISYKNFVGQSAANAVKKAYSTVVYLSQFKDLGNVKNPDPLCTITTGLNFLQRTFECDTEATPPRYYCDIAGGGICSINYTSVPSESVFNATFGSTSSLDFWVPEAKKVYPELTGYDSTISKVNLCFSIEMDIYREDYSAKTLQVRCPTNVFGKETKHIKGLEIATSTKNFSTSTGTVIFDEAALWKINGFDTIPASGTSASKVDNVCVNLNLEPFYRSLYPLETVKNWIKWDDAKPKENCLKGNPNYHTEVYECRIETVKANGLVSASRPVSFSITFPDVVWMKCGEETKTPTAKPSKTKTEVIIYPDPPSYAP